MLQRADLTILLLILQVLLLAGTLCAYLSLRRRLREQNSSILSDAENLLDETEDHITDRVAGRIAEIRGDIGERLRSDAEENRRNRTEVSGMIRDAGARQDQSLTRLTEQQRAALERLTEEQRTAMERLTLEERTAMERLDEKLNRRLSELQEQQFRKLEEYGDRTEAVLKQSITELQEANGKKLAEMQREINTKLDTGLSERLDNSFKTVGEQLNRLYESLGELNRLENGVSTLNRTLSNVKTRGIFGETQLENLLANVLSPGLYDRNVVTKKSDGHNRDSVEFAIRIPDRDTAGSFLYLPIDSKYPADLYEKIRAASEEGNAEELRKSVKELEQRIREEARDIRDKYLDPPATTDFAVMFLPTEALYAEVLRIPGLVEEAQKKDHIVITGPTTAAALLNSLSIGFRYMAVNRDSKNILKLLSAIKTQYQTMSRLVETADNRIEMARKATADLQKRTEMINKKLSAVEEIDPIEARSLLGLQTSGREDDTV